MKFQPREWSLMVVGVAIGGVIAGLSISHQTPPSNQDQAESRPDQLANEVAVLTANANLRELQQFDGAAEDNSPSEAAPRTTVQQWAASVPYENDSQSSYDRSLAYANSLKPSSPSRSVLDVPSSSRTYLERQQATAGTFGSGPGSFDEAGAGSGHANNVGAIDARTGQYYAPAGPGGYVNTQNGTFYAPAGPNGVTDTRTGQYIPVSP